MCGDDGYTYRSLCLLEQTACQQGKNITAVYAGQCLLQSNSSSWEEGQAHYDDYSEDDQILCPTNCDKVGFLSPQTHFPQMYNPVCGMDNVTYSNECFLRKAECSSRMVIQVGPVVSSENCKRFVTSAPAYWVGS